eukprot:SAG31_NODE_2652_length_5296_cov_7.770637_6_plen_130_part_00
MWELHLSERGVHCCHSRGYGEAWAEGSGLRIRQRAYRPTLLTAAVGPSARLQAGALHDRDCECKSHLLLQLDDGWAAVERDAATERQVAVERKFPSGMRRVADRVHALGLKFGLYTALAAQTCGGRELD